MKRSDNDIEKSSPHRKSSPRKRDFDYSQPGAYFITICTQNKMHLFGEIVEEEMILNPIGKIILGCWYDLLKYYSNLELDQFIIMPNHVHGIIVIKAPVGTGLALSKYAEKESTKPDSPRAVPTNQTLSNIVGRFKSVSTIQVNKFRSTPGTPIWQRSFFDRILRNENEWNRVRKYILQNPLNWNSDSENPFQRSSK
jgi:REP element-mobilizing transposase RayT